MTPADIAAPALFGRECHGLWPLAAQAAAVANAATRGASEMAHAFRSLGCPEPVALFTSGTAALTMCADCDRGFAKPWTDTELIEQLRTFKP